MINVEFGKNTTKEKKRIMIVDWGNAHRWPLDTMRNAKIINNNANSMQKMCYDAIEDANA